MVQGEREAERAFSAGVVLVPLTRKSLKVAVGSADVGLRIDRAVQRLCGLPRAQVTALFDHDCVRLNDALCKAPGHRLEEGDRVVLCYDAHQRYHRKNKPRRHLGFEIIFEDRDLIVVLKPAELLTIPTRRGESNTLVHKVTAYVRHVGGGQKVFTAQRLDRGVSGLLVLGKSLEVAEALRDQFAMHKPEREYVALVAGELDDDQGTFESLLATDKNLKRFSTDDEQIGQRAVTHFRVTRRLGDATLVQVWLETGRRNQIRVHFADAGHPILGDPRYEPRLAAHRRWPHKRLALHARTLGFDHPVTGQHLRFTSPLPAEMERFVKRR